MTTCRKWISHFHLQLTSRFYRLHSRGTTWCWILRIQRADCSLLLRKHRSWFVLKYSNPKNLSFTFRICTLRRDLEHTRFCSNWTWSTRTKLSSFKRSTKRCPSLSTSSMPMQTLTRKRLPPIKERWVLVGSTKQLNSQMLICTPRIKTTCSTTSFRFQVDSITIATRELSLITCTVSRKSIMAGICRKPSKKGSPWTINTFWMISTTRLAPICSLKSTKNRTKSKWIISRHQTQKTKQARTSKQLAMEVLNEAVWMTTMDSIKLRPRSSSKTSTSTKWLINQTMNMMMQVSWQLISDYSRAIKTKMNIWMILCSTRKCKEAPSCRFTMKTKSKTKAIDTQFKLTKLKL